MNFFGIILTNPRLVLREGEEQRIKWFRHGYKTGDMKMLKQIFEMPYEDL